MSEVPVWPNFAFRFWGQMTSKVKIFEKCLCWFIDGIPNYVSWPNLVKIGRCEVAERSRGLPHTKTSRSAGLVPAPILSKMGWSRPKFPERCQPLTCPRILNLVRIGCALPNFQAFSLQYRLSAYKNRSYNKTKENTKENKQRTQKKLPVFKLSRLKVERHL